MSDLVTTRSLSFMAKTNMVQHWLFSVNRDRRRPITINQVRTLPVNHPQYVFEPPPDDMLRILLTILEQGKADIQPHIILSFIKREIIHMYERWFCPFCSGFSRSKNVLYGHINIAHATEPFKCLCGTSLLSTKDVNCHLTSCTKLPVYPKLSKEWINIISSSMNSENFYISSNHRDEVRRVMNGN